MIINELNGKKIHLVGVESFIVSPPHFKLLHVNDDAIESPLKYFLLVSPEILATAAFVDHGTTHSN